MLAPLRLVQRTATTIGPRPSRAGTGVRDRIARRCWRAAALWSMGLRLDVWSRDDGLMIALNGKGVFALAR